MAGVMGRKRNGKKSNGADILEKDDTRTWLDTLIGKN